MTYNKDYNKEVLDKYTLLYNKSFIIYLQQKNQLIY